MDMTTLFVSQCTDLFRIGLLAGLLLTMERTRAQTGVMLPLLAGIAFVAVIIPSTMPKPGVSLQQAMLSGVVANAVILAILWLILTAFKKFRK